MYTVVNKFINNFSPFPHQCLRICCSKNDLRALNFFSSRFRIFHCRKYGFCGEITSAMTEGWRWTFLLKFKLEMLESSVVWLDTEELELRLLRLFFRCRNLSLPEEAAGRAGTPLSPGTGVVGPPKYTEVAAFFGLFSVLFVITLRAEDSLDSDRLLPGCKLQLRDSPEPLRLSI